MTKTNGQAQNGAAEPRRMGACTNADPNSTRQKTGEIAHPTTLLVDKETLEKMGARKQGGADAEA